MEYIASKGDYLPSAIIINQPYSYSRFLVEIEKISAVLNIPNIIIYLIMKSIMHLIISYVALGAVTPSSAFQTHSRSRSIQGRAYYYQHHTSALRNAYVDISEDFQRDINPMLSWSEMYGIQRNLEFCTTSSFKDLNDASDMTW